MAHLIVHTVKFELENLLHDLKQLGKSARTTAKHLECGFSPPTRRPPPAFAKPIGLYTRLPLQQFGTTRL